MTIIRQLVTKLSFKTDFTNLRKFEDSIVGLKSKITLAATGLAYFAKKTLDYFSDISEGTRITANLAKQANIATEDFIALREAAKSFQIKPESFYSALSRLTKLLREGKRGIGELFDIERRSGFKLNLQRFAGIGDVQGSLKAIGKYVNSIRNLNDQLTALEDILKIDTATAHAFLDAIQADPKVLQELIEKNRELAQSQAELLPKTKAYETALVEFNRSLDAFVTFLVTHILPFVTSILNFTNEASKGIIDIKNTTQEKGFLKTFNDVAAATFEPLKRFLGFSDPESFHKAKVEMNNNVNISVPPGTDEQQAIDIAKEIDIALRSSELRMNRELISNFPQVEFA